MRAVLCHVMKGRFWVVICFQHTPRRRLIEGGENAGNWTGQGVTVEGSKKRWKGTHRYFQAWPSGAHLGSCHLK
ncbi:hypothetical protein VTH06DRAFT_1356 [Thermothelomyces fergusii]